MDLIAFSVFLSVSLLFSLSLSLSYSLSLYDKLSLKIFQRGIFDSLWREETEYPKNHFV